MILELLFLLRGIRQVCFIYELGEMMLEIVDSQHINSVIIW